jgi:hypothetical protein
MALKQKEVVIGGDVYLLQTIPATKGLKLLKQITKLVGPAFGELTKSEGGVSQAIEKLIENLDQVEIEVLVKELCTSATKNKMTINFDYEFAGEYEKLFKLTKEIVEFNYGSVFTMVGIGEEVQG